MSLKVKWEIFEDFGRVLGENIIDPFDYCGIVLVVGYVPGLKVDTIPLVRSKTVRSLCFKATSL